MEGCLNNRGWVVKRDDGSSEERKLELRLAPPGEDWSIKIRGGEEEEECVLSLGYLSGNHKFENPWGVSHESAAEKKKAFSIPANTAVPNTSQKRSAAGPVVGWPPIRSFRKNLGSSSSTSKVGGESSQNEAVCSEKAVDKCKKGLFVKINMEGVPIGRKVDLKAYDSYEKLSVGVDQLFRGLVAGQRESCGDGMKKEEEEKAISGVLDGSGEYTLVYEDNEGDRMLAGDVPWHMFVSTVNRLRLLKTSQLSALTLGRKHQKIELEGRA